ncbi:MAG: calcium-translocating P-type ATPase, PMCA-type [Lachnospiraceae bacterium]|nr:calcium-translocating P-type ATPase, PMCA-type [Lachnospiraceae bacterium]
MQVQGVKSRGDQGATKAMQAHTRGYAEVVKDWKSNEVQGLSSQEAAKRLATYGKNEFVGAKKRSLPVRFLAQFSDFMILVLIAAAVVSFVISVLNHETDFVDPIIILAIVILNAVLGVMQEQKAEKSLEALKKLSAPAAMVLREGSYRRIPARELVPGDIIRVEAGDYVPADARLLAATGLQVDESALTGESVAVRKSATGLCKADAMLAERCNMIYSTCIVTGGHAKAVVVATGMGTEVGRIADMILNDEAPDTPLQKRLAQIGKGLGMAALGICVAIFLMGAVQGRDIFDMFMTSVSLAVAAIPEALPGLVTIMLSLGVQRMAQKNAVIKHLPAVETLGSATYICSDKTGTLTQNEMRVVRVCTLDGEANKRERERILSCAALCSNATLSFEKRKVKVTGEATEKALVKALYEEGILKDQLELRVRRLAEQPFDSVKKTMTTLHEAPEGRVCITKGAPEILLHSCSYYEQAGRVKPMTEAVAAQLRGLCRRLSKEALRVLAVAWKRCEENGDRAEAALKAGSEQLVFLGFVGMMDPPREEAAECVRKCRAAGITPVMITGDHILTACAIARQLGLLIEEEGEKAISGAELEKMSEEELRQSIRKYRVFARVSPEHKVRIVRALQQSGEIVAMTGDGVNDAPALKAADIGCAMGRNGTDVAKNAADMVLLDDNFATIVEAVQEGRGIYDNIRKSVHFLLSSNIGEIITIFSAILCRMPSPLAAVQLLWVNLVTDSLPALALGVEPPEEGIMRRKPLSPEKGLFADGLIMQIVVEGIMIGLLAMIAYQLGGSTYAFGVLSFSQLFHAFNVRSSRSLFEIGFFRNRRMTLAFTICAVMQVAVLSIPMAARIFSVVPLTLKGWGIVLGLSVVPIVVVELQKRSRKRKKD